MPTDFSAILPTPVIDPIITKWLSDDMPSFDVGGLVVGSSPASASLFLKSPGVFAGKPFFDRVFELLGCTVEWLSCADEEGIYHDPEKSGSGGKIKMAVVKGPVNKILQGERTALNTLSRVSGVATASRNAKDIAEKIGWRGSVAGTRKTTPGFRIAEKYGLLVGGVATHRLDLSQMVMLKDNHIWAEGSITNAVKMARRACGFSAKIEVECQSLEEGKEAAKAGADIVMLDNFEPDALKRDAKELKGEFPFLTIEASGGITMDTLGLYLSEDVDVVSSGKLTQGYSCLDYSLKIDR